MRRAPVVTLVAALTLALTACADDPEPSGLPTNAATPAETMTNPASTPSRTPPTAPPAIHEQTEEGGKAATKFFIQTLEYFFNTGDPALMQSAATPECQSCNEVITNVGKLYSAGGYMQTGSYVVTDVTLTADYGPKVKSFAAHGTQPRQDQFNETGKVIKIEPEASLAIVCGLEWHVDRWLVAEYKA